MSSPLSSSLPVPIVSSVREVADGSRAWLVDIWGVMHNGVAPFLPAAAATAEFRSRGGVVILVSNAPRPASSVAEQIERIGVPRDAYDTIITSGDVCRATLASVQGGLVHHLGPERDKPLFEGLPLTFVKADAAQIVVCTGLFDDARETAEDYRAMLETLRHRRIPMLCANPDLTVERGSQIVYCAGAIAQLYEELGGEVIYAGKPYLPIYEKAFAEVERLLGQAVSRQEILAIGDGLRTDIAGAAQAGIRSVFVASGIHVGGGQLDPAVLGHLFPDAAKRPIAAMQHLAP